MILKTSESIQRHPHSAVNFRSPFSVKMLTLQFSTDGQRTDNEGRNRKGPASTEGRFLAQGLRSGKIPGSILKLTQFKVKHTSTLIWFGKSMYMYMH